MKTPKDRKTTPLLLSQYKAQETRIAQCGNDAYLRYYLSLYASNTGSIYTVRFKAS